MLLYRINIKLPTLFSSADVHLPFSCIQNNVGLVHFPLLWLNIHDLILIPLGPNKLSSMLNLPNPVQRKNRKKYLDYSHFHVKYRLFFPYNEKTNILFYTYYYYLQSTKIVTIGPWIVRNGIQFFFQNCSVHCKY